MKKVSLIALLLIVISCTENTQPKPNAFLKLSYPKLGYKKSPVSPPFSFEYSNSAQLYLQKNHWFNIIYPKLKAGINATYHPIENNLTQLILDAEKLTFKHTVKADNIEMFPFENKEKKVYAKLFEVSGDAASQIQFQITDSVHHFINGALYFDVKPNYDSIYPAVDFIKRDVKKMIESMDWR